MPFFGPRVAHGEAGSLGLSVSYVGQAADESGGWRSRFLYRVDGPPGASASTFVGSDLYSGVSAETTAREMLQSLASFLAAAGERYATGMSAPDADFPEWVYEAGYLNSDELSLLAEGADEPGETPAMRVDYVSIVFQEGTEADQALAILDEDGPSAAVAHLAQWDYGEETEMAAREYGHAYPEPPTGRDDRSHVEGDYVLAWNLPLGHVSLVRRVEVPVPAEEAPRPANVVSQPPVNRSRAVGSATPLAAKPSSGERGAPSR
ncbi:MAG TPA: hypothetical protein VGC18_06325 [Lacisediminihabitans sp.]|jgi:hypothetical protein|uniref:hypothetical protein n=1 Tax=Lacisediminihabitans sp. TaxID=2787631 RepID=UPI002EDA1A43